MAPRIALLKGPETLLRDEHTDSIRAELAKEHGDIDTVRLDGGSAALADVLDECRSFGLMAPYKLVIVDDADELCAAEDRREVLIRYAHAPSEAATLVLRAGPFNFPKLEKAIAAAGVLLPCAVETVKDLGAWITRRAKQHHKAAIEPDAVALLTERHRDSLAKIDAELAKLAGAAAGKPITAALARELGGGHREMDPFKIQAALLSGDPTTTLRGIRDVLDNARTQASIPVGIAALQTAVNLHEMALTGRSKAWGDTAALLGRYRGKLHPIDAKALLNVALTVDVHNKSGVGDPVRNLEMLALRFAETLAGR